MHTDTMIVELAVCHRKAALSPCFSYSCSGLASHRTVAYFLVKQFSMRFSIELFSKGLRWPRSLTSETTEHDVAVHADLRNKPSLQIVSIGIQMLGAQILRACSKYCILIVLSFGHIATLRPQQRAKSRRRPSQRSLAETLLGTVSSQNTCLDLYTNN